MSAVIYETINLYNEKHNLIPYRYIGSSQHDNPLYFGSSKLLQSDVKKLGVQFFKKNIICEFNEDIPNVLLREIESNVQIFIDVANHPDYYNITNKSHKGYVETEEQKRKRIQKTLDKRKIWWDSLSENDKITYKKKSSNHLKAYNKNRNIKGKTYEEIYGEDKGSLMRKNRHGEKNGMCKFTDEQKEEIIKLYSQGKTRSEITKLTNVSYGVVKLTIRDQNIPKYMKFSHEELIKLINEGKNKSQISRILKINRTSITAYIKKHCQVAKLADAIQQNVDS